MSSRAHLIFPWHQAHDAIAETLRGDDKIGTTLKGIGPAYADKARRVGIRAGDVLDPGRFSEQVRARAIAENRQLTDDGGEALDVDDVVGTFDALGARLAPYVTDTVSLLHDALATGAHLLLEGAQATFLDLDHGTYPFVTSSNPTAGGACAGTGLGPRDIDRDRRDHQGVHDTGRRRAVPDRAHRCRRRPPRRRRPRVRNRHRPTPARRLARLRDAAPRRPPQQPHRAGASPSSTSSTGSTTVKVCTGYRLGGQTLPAYPDRVDVLSGVEPVYETLPGWGIGARRRARAGGPAGQAPGS